MECKFKNDLANGTMKVTITLKHRSRVHHPRIRVKWNDVKNIVNTEYTPPSSHVLGECKEKYKVIDNNYINGCTATWEFDLVPVRQKRTKTPEPTAPTRTPKSATPRKTTTAVKTTNSKKTTKSTRKTITRKK